MENRNNTMTAVLQDRRLRQTIERLALAGEGDEQGLENKARNYFLKIASNYSERWPVIWEKVLTGIWRAIYDDFIVDRRGLAGIGEISRRMPVVIIPCHRSHLDYLVFSYIIYKHGVPLPRVAAGDNMDFWPLGYVFRKSGAFFLRRSFRDDDLYADVFAAYVKFLLRENVPIEFFLEGSRSRTGKMLMPKYGMISMLVRAWQDGICDDLALIPVHIGYDRIVEEEAYLKELKGMAKRRESVLDVIRHAKIVMRRYGRVYINVGEPLYLKHYMACRQKSLAGAAGDDSPLLFQDIGCAVASEIDRVSVVTPVSLLAAALLCHERNDIAGPLLTATFTVLYDYLARRRVNMAPALAVREQAVPGALELFCRWGYLHSQRLWSEDKVLKDSYLLPGEKRMNLEYYKNTIVRHFLALSFAALSILSQPDEEITINRIGDDCIFMRSLFSQEFIFGEDEKDEINQALAYLEDRGAISSRGSCLAWAKEGSQEELRIYSGLIRSCLESYSVVLNACLAGQDKLAGVKNPMQHLQRSAAEMLERGDILRSESLSQEYYANALKFLQKEGMIAFTSLYKEKGRGGISVTDEERLEDTRRRLSRFL